MSKLTMMKGIPASGKSTMAREIVEGGGNYIRLNRDLLREMLHFGKYTGKNERTVVEIEREVAAMMLRSGHNVVVDDCNLNPKNEDMWREVAKGNGAKFETKVLHTPLADCLERNKHRDKQVPEHVIVDMALQMGSHPACDQEVVVCDIDGTIANVDHRLHHVRGDTKDWKSFFSEMDKDVLREEVDAKLIDHTFSGRRVIFVSARPEDYRGMTEKWIEDNVSVVPDAIIMRPSGDTRPDTEVKKAIYDKYLKDLHIHCVIDDRPSVIRMWRDLKLTVDDVGPGKEF